MNKPDWGKLAVVFLALEHRGFVKCNITLPPLPRAWRCNMLKMVGKLPAERNRMGYFVAFGFGSTAAGSVSSG